MLDSRPRYIVMAQAIPSDRDATVFHPPGKAAQSRDEIRGQDLRSIGSLRQIVPPHRGQPGPAAVIHHNTRMPSSGAKRESH